MTAFSAKQKHDAVDRELRYRRRVFPRLIANGKMTQRLADEQIAVFEQIMVDYANAETKERLL